MIGFKNEFPTIDDPLTTPLFTMTILLAFGIPALLLGISITMMKFYKLDDKKMEEIQATIAEMKDKPKNIEDPAI